MKTIRCNAITEDRYPAGLDLASRLWEILEQNTESDVSIPCIRSFWDGAKLEGKFGKKHFWIEMNYGTENIVLLLIHSKKTIFESQKTQENFEEEIKILIEKSIERLPNRKIIESP